VNISFIVGAFAVDVLAFRISIHPLSKIQVETVSFGCRSLDWLLKALRRVKDAKAVENTEI